MKQNRLPRLSLLAASACAALTLQSAWAAPVLSSGSVALTPPDGAATPSTVNSPGHTYSSSSAGRSTGTADASAWANQNGAYAVRSSAEGIGTASSFAKLVYQLTNNSSNSLLYSMNLHIYGGSISAALSPVGPPPLTFLDHEYLTASYRSTVSVINGSTTSTAFKSQATIRNDKDGVALTREAGSTLLNSANLSDAVYSWGTGDYLVELGLVGAGATVSIEIDLADSVDANVGTYDFTGGGSGDYGGPSCGSPNFGLTSAGLTSRSVGVAQCFKGDARAFYGDPITFFPGGPNVNQNAPLITFNSRAAPVPEPGSLPLVALALLAAGAMARRRRA